MLRSFVILWQSFIVIIYLNYILCNNNNNYKLQQDLPASPAKMEKCRIPPMVTVCKIVFT